MPASAGAPPSAKVINIGGFLPIGNVGEALRMQAAEAPSAKSAFEESQSKPVITGLAGFIRNFFQRAQDARTTVETEMIEALYARRGQYTPEKLQQIKENRQPAIYMMVASAKMRQIEALLRDILLGTGGDKPWTAQPTPDPEIPPELAQQLVMQLQQEVMAAMQTGFMPSVQAAAERARELKTEVQNLIVEKAKQAAERAEIKMEDQQVEGGFYEALDAFITDLATFKTAFMAGPILRNKPKLKWGPGRQAIVEQKLCPEWERVDPFDMYPAPWATDLQHAPFVRVHHLTREALTEMIGVDGFNEDAIREILTRYGDMGHSENLQSDNDKAYAEGRETVNSQETWLIDAIQYWGSASGKMLRQWGMTEQEVPDETKQYQIEAWMVGSIVFKAVLNSDPLARRPIYYTSFQRVPGTVWGNAPYDLCRDCQDMCNGAARSLGANIAISSGPQVSVLANRIPAGEDITEMFPWKIWQFEADTMGSTASPITFFQPNSNANELMAVFERFSLLADEYTGIPRYMAGFNGGEGGAGRTASGISMMIGNASKTIKQVLGNIDTHILKPLIERQYYHNRVFSEDPDFDGDIAIKARGALSLQTKEAAQVRNNEFLQVALNSPVAQQIMGIEGVAEILRGTVKQLDHNVDRVVPSTPVLRQRMAQQQYQQMLATQATAQPQKDKPPGGSNLMDGSPATNNFTPVEG